MHESRIAPLTAFEMDVKHIRSDRGLLSDNNQSKFFAQRFVTQISSKIRHMRRRP